MKEIPAIRFRELGSGLVTFRLLLLVGWLAASSPATAQLSSLGAEIWSRAQGLPGDPATGDQLGSVLVSGDFDGDGFEDLALGAPGADVSGSVGLDAGAVLVIYGQAGALDGQRTALFQQGRNGILGASETGDAFGTGLAVGDFDGNGFDDLAVGAPLKNMVGAEDAGSVTVIYGSSAGLAGASGQVWTQETQGIPGGAQQGDHFGQALAAGDFDNDGFDDLAMGSPGQDALDQADDAGRVTILYGGPSRLTAGRAAALRQGTFDVTGDSETGDVFASALAAGDFNNDGFADLAVGVPGKVVGGLPLAGLVVVLYGSAAGLSGTGSQPWTQNSDGVPGDSQAGDKFGSALAVGDFNADGFSDLASGAPGKTVPFGQNDVAEGVGSVVVLYGGAERLSASGAQSLTQGEGEVPGPPQEFDAFGSALAAGDFDGDGFHDLAIGSPGEAVNTVQGAGAVIVLAGSAQGVSASAAQVWHQNLEDIPGAVQPQDSFGAALATGDFNGDGFRDLAVGAPLEDLPPPFDVGEVLLLYGSSATVSSRGFTSAASFELGAVAPGEIISIFARDIGPEQDENPPVGAPELPTLLGGVQVLFDGAAAPLFYVSASQLNVQVPYTVAGKDLTQVQIFRDLQLRNPVAARIAVTAARPALFLVGEGRAVVLNQDNSVNSPANAALRGEIVILWATGEGQTNPPGQAGKLAGDPFPKPIAEVRVSIGGLNVESRDILYAGSAPGFAGLMQVNVRVPTNIAPGDAVPVVLQVGDASSPAGVGLAVAFPEAEP